MMFFIFEKASISILYYLLKNPTNLSISLIYLTKSISFAINDDEVVMQAL